VRPAGCATAPIAYGFSTTQRDERAAIWEARMARWIKSTEFIKFEVDGPIARIIFNRPEKLNAFTDEMDIEVRDALKEADDRVDVSVVIIEGAGGNFSPGHDITKARAMKKQYAEDLAAGKTPEYRTLSSFDEDAWYLERVAEVKMFLFDMHKPTIAKVDGYCLGVATDFMMMCDITIASNEARIGFPPARANGTPPHNWWLYHVGPQWAKRMLFTGDMLSGEDAAKVGLVCDSVPQDQLEDAVYSLAYRISRNDHEMLAAHKRSINLGLELMGARTMQRLSNEFDVRAHFAKGPRRAKFSADFAEHGLKTALTNRDRAFGDGMIRMGGVQPLILDDE
jgi:enoyl-CoA hydratase